MSGARILALVTDGYGGRGGIAAYVRDSLAAMGSDPRIEEVVAVHLFAAAEKQLPERVRVIDAQGSKLRYLALVAREVAAKRFDGVWASHLSLSAVAFVAALLMRVRWALILHGIEAWPRRGIARRLARRADLLLPVSHVTLERFLGHSNGERPHLVSPGTVDLDRFTPGPADPELRRELGLEDRRVLLTLGRLSRLERAKGFDRMIRLLPQLAERWPDIAYVIAGDGDDRPFLESLAREMGVSDRVRFAGYVREERKADFYRLADVYVMPSTGEGLGLVFLEAMACGVPAIASAIDGGREAVEGMGLTVDPHDPAAIAAAIAEALEMPRQRPAGLERFAKPAFDQRVREALTLLLRRQAH